MENVVAVQVELEDGTSRYFVTWGRIQAPVDTSPLAELVLRYVSRGHLSGSPPPPKRARVCGTLAEVPLQDAPYFYEALLYLAHRPIPYGSQYEQWRSERDTAMAAGEDLYYCGDPAGPLKWDKAWVRVEELPRPQGRQ